ncbi:hypothetical protein GCM10007857_47290 [Bradyrhizobium iriomotense]|uniref:Uncharacterized protein n=1 Tax=Bradyrhizobium iriomotense TaxID=441950 RepID=A0ABQ6B0V7_9BRAD|nr:hypothetical protein GCM10007857_47290 [Bradyrhizobium iriomotense]
MHAREGAAQSVGIRGNQDEMHVVRHQAPRPHLDAGGFAIRRKQVAIERIVVIAKERASPAVAALGDVVRITGDDDTGETGHAAACMRESRLSIQCTVTVILPIRPEIWKPPSLRHCERSEAIQNLYAETDRIASLRSQ